MFPTMSRNPGGLTKHLQRVPVVCAMMACYDKGQNLARDFWSTVRDESAPDRDDATRTLARFLLRCILSSGRGTTKRDQKSVGFREMYVKCLHAWNAWRKGETTSLAYHVAAPIPKIEK